MRSPGHSRPPMKISTNGVCGGALSASCSCPPPPRRNRRPPRTNRRHWRRRCQPVPRHWPLKKKTEIVRQCADRNTYNICFNGLPLHWTKWAVALIVGLYFSRFNVDLVLLRWHDSACRYTYIVPVIEAPDLWCSKSFRYSLIKYSTPPWMNFNMKLTRWNGTMIYTL